MINRPIFLDSHRRRRRFLAALAALIGTALFVAALFFSLGALITH